MKINLLDHRLIARRMTDQQTSTGEIVIPDTDWEKGINLSVHKDTKTFYVVSPPDIKDREKFLDRLRTTFPNIEFIPIDPVDPVDIDKQAMHQLATELPANKITESDVFLGIAAGSYKGSIASIGLIARGVSPTIGFASFLFQLGDTMLTITGRPVFNKIILSNWHNPKKKVSVPTAYIRNMSIDGVTMAFAGFMVPATQGALSLTSTSGFLGLIALIIGNQYLNSLFLTTLQKKEENRKLTKVGARWGLFYKMLATQPFVLAKLFNLGSINIARAAYPGLLFKGSIGTIIPAIPAFIILFDLWTVLIAATYLTMIAWAYYFHESMNRTGAASQAKLDKILERKVIGQTLGAPRKRERLRGIWPIGAAATKNVAIFMATYLERYRKDIVSLRRANAKIPAERFDAASPLKQIQEAPHAGRNLRSLRNRQPAPRIGTASRIGQIPRRRSRRYRVRLGLGATSGYPGRRERFCHLRRCPCLRRRERRCHHG